MSQEMSDLYIFVCLRVTGKSLEAKATNRVIEQYNSRLRELKIKEQRADGKVFKAWVSDVDEFRHELLNRNMLLCSRKVRFEIRDPLPHSHNNHMHFIQVKIHKALMGLTVKNGTPYNEDILIETTGTHILGNTRTGRWPSDVFDQITF